jgi:drug/metabolite transporter (DMT)-like permease
MMHIYSYSFEKSVPLALIDYRVWFAIAYLLIIGSLISFIAYINPIIALLLGFAWRNEKLNWYIGIGAAVTLIGVYLVNNAFNKQPEIES